MFLLTSLPQQSLRWLDIMSLRPLRRLTHLLHGPAEHRGSRAIVPRLHRLLSPLCLKPFLHLMAQPVIITVPATKREISVNTGLFINNEFVSSADSAETIQSVAIVGLLHYPPPAHPDIGNPLASPNGPSEP